jgi:hypothetical protein
MKGKYWYLLWASMYVLCLVLGAAGAGGFAALAIGLLFFLAPAVLLYRAEDRSPCALLIRNLSAASLGLTALVMVLNVLSVLWPQWLGDALYILLLMVSVPMACGGAGLLSLFCWACLLMVSLKKTRKKK